MCFRNLKRIIVSNRLGHALVVAHLITCICLFVGKPTVRREAANAPADERTVSTSTLLAGRSFHFSHESVFSKVLAVFDFPGLCVGLFVSFLLTAFIQLFFSLGAYDQSWLVASMIFVATSVQWLAVGYVLRVTFSNRLNRASELKSQ